MNAEIVLTRKVRDEMTKEPEFFFFKKRGCVKLKDTIQQRRYGDGLFQHVVVHPLHSALSPGATGTSCCTPLPQRRATASHPALHPELTKHSVTVSETSFHFCIIFHVEKKTKTKKKNKKPVSATVGSVTRHKIERAQQQIDFYGHI